MMVSLEGKVVIATGAASGIGRAVAVQAAQSGVDALLLTDRDETGCLSTQELLSDYPTRVAIHVGDLLDPLMPTQISDAALDHFGRIDGLVNSAGLTTRASFESGTLDDWDALLAVNMRAPFFLMQAAIRDMRLRQAPGAIVNILSINAHCGSPELSIYSATKGALLTLTKNAANAYMGDRIRANGINLGWAQTEAEDKMQADTLGLGAEWSKLAAAGLPLGRLVQPEEAARLAVFLLSEASAPMSGVAVDLEQRVTGANG
jgi:NAD(P)-dependent dehydrogenase (short-subunit alcohol dehydrogenase family)